MAINLKPVDVAVIGLGAAGGVAVLPLARAGVKIAGIEAGGWMDPHNFRPDEINNNVRHLVTSVPKAQREIPTIRTGPGAPAIQAPFHPMMNAIGGTSIHFYWAQSWRPQALGLQDALGNDQALRERAPFRPDRRSKTGLSAMTISNLTTTKWNTKSACRGRRATFRASSIPDGNVYEAVPGSASILDASFARQRFLRIDGGRRAEAGLEAFSRPRRHQFAALEEPPRLRLSRLLRHRRLPHQRQKLDRRHYDSRGAKDQKPADFRLRAGDSHRRRQAMAA